MKNEDTSFKGDIHLVLQLCAAWWARYSPDTLGQGTKKSPEQEQKMNHSTGYAFWDPHSAISLIYAESNYTEWIKPSCKVKFPSSSSQLQALLSMHNNLFQQYVKLLKTVLNINWKTLFIFLPVLPSVPAKAAKTLTCPSFPVGRDHLDWGWQCVGLFIWYTKCSMM